jgi:arylsulfatase A-like enzyme
MLMMRRLMLVVAVLLATAVCGRAVGAAENRPMNLLVIETDEHHFGTLGCYGGEIVGTPNIDSIAADGALCRRFYAVTPVCSPSRASLVSGLYPQKTPVVTNNIPLDDSIVTFAEVLRRRGYATGFAGKWHLDGTGKPQWAPERTFGFEDNRFMFNRGHWKKLIDTSEGPAVGSRNKNGRPNYGLEGADETSFTTDWLANKTIDFIETNKDRPFCYMVSIPDPHGPNTVRPPYDTMYADVKVPIPVTLRRRQEQIPGWGRSAGVTAAQLRRLMPPYWGMVKCIDDNVGRILETLRKHDLLDKTVVVFTSDHGDLCGEHGRLNKGVPYEGSARIPMLVRCPGKIKPGTKVDEALTTIDFLPTVLALLDVPLEHHVDGRDASALLTGNAKDWDDVAFLRSTPGGVWLGAVTGRYKLIYSAADEPWLIDMQQDPTEVVNRFDQAEHRDRIRTLTARLLDYCKTHNDPYARVPKIQEAMTAVLGQ